MQLSHMTGYAYDVFNAGKMIKHISDALCTDIGQYPDCCESAVKIYNVTAPNWEIVAIGFNGEPGDVSYPCLMHNIETDDWAYSRNLVWFENKQGFCWSGGHYNNTKEEAKESFSKMIKGHLYYTEDY